MDGTDFEIRVPTNGADGTADGSDNGPAVGPANGDIRCTVKQCTA